ncbi:Serine 3-dehydrogenase [BD1-7 clade bacterium]|uniref:Serine 3-dehydrogenase n=1 Tax=BD1-7 clade bacterium TaxID=2029982 RepID=A0A5S9R1X4_9GAMM|nr:Serine 3-dehydrogenase [BD1-7 clade bacterium]
MKPVPHKRRIWVTGATSGIGQALALKLAANGHSVIASGRNADALEELAGVRGITAKAVDVSNAESLKNAQKAIAQQFGALDTVVVNAGVCEYLQNLPADMEMWERIYSTNLKGAIATIDCALPLLAASEFRGQVVGVVSQVIFAPFSQAEFYGASKAALDYYLKSLAIDLKQKQIDVARIYPGFVKTPLTDKNHFDMPFIVSAEDAANTMTHAIEDRKTECIFPKRLYYVLKTSQWFPSFWTRKFSQQSRVALALSDA